MITEAEVELNPGVCAYVGLDCHECTARAARQVATLCSNMGATHLESTFFRMYSGIGCSPMLSNFVEAYFAATEPEFVLVDEPELACCAA